MDAPLPAGLTEAWREFLSRERSLAELYAHPMLFPLQRQAEMAEMHRRAREINPRVVCEIGADKAGSVWAWLKALPAVKRVLAVEIRGTPYAAEFERAFPRVDFLWLSRSSYEARTVALADDWLGPDTIDVLFLDGDKAAFLRDWKAYRPCMTPGGLVVMHDIQDSPGPRDAFREVGKLGYATEAFIDVSDWRAAERREADGLPPAGSHEGWLRTWKGHSAGCGFIHIPR